MIPIADLHIHLLAGLDDGPKTEEEAIEMCRLAVAQGAGAVHALAHQNEEYPHVTPEVIWAAGKRLSDLLREHRIPLAVFPGSEVMVHPEIIASWTQGQLATIGNRKQFMLIEMPHGLCVDIRYVVDELRRVGVRPILAHPEQVPELLHNEPLMEELVNLGCLIQVSTGNLLKPRTREDAGRLKSWFRRNLVHVLGSDGHSPRRRPPVLAGCHEIIARWAGLETADRVCNHNAMAILQGLPLRHPPIPPKGLLSWLPRLW